MEIIKFDNFSFKYNNNNKFILKNINLSINKGELILFIGLSGSGKTTLLKNLKIELLPYGEKKGEIYLENISLQKFSKEMLNKHIGYLGQDISTQFITEKVWSELAFGLENLNTPIDIMKRKIAEISCYFNLNNIYNKSSNKISGGEKQMVNLASILIMNPKILILDEPISQLDPIASDNFINTIKKLKSNSSTTFLISEQNISNFFEISDKIVLMNNGNINFYGNKNDFIDFIYKDEEKNSNLIFVPNFIKIIKHIDKKNITPININQSIKIINTYNKFITKKLTDEIIPICKKNIEENIFKIENLYYKYEDSNNHILKNCNLKINKKDMVSIIGGNGSGKTTLLKNILSIYKPNHGKIIFNKKYKKKNNFLLNISYLPQEVLPLFIKDSIKEELSRFYIKENPYTDIIKKLEIDNLLDKHPYDLSGGELQKVAIAKSILHRPDLLIMDEPTKNLDERTKLKIGNVLNDINNLGITIIYITHDIEFAGEYSKTSALLFDGEIALYDSTRNMFCNNMFYTTSTNIITQNVIENLITFKDFENAWGNINEYK